MLMLMLMLTLMLMFSRGKKHSAALLRPPKSDSTKSGN